MAFLLPTAAGNTTTIRQKCKEFVYVSFGQFVSNLDDLDDADVFLVGHLYAFLRFCLKI
jgi:hypothetical protein